MTYTRRSFLEKEALALDCMHFTTNFLKVFVFLFKNVSNKIFLLNSYKIGQNDSQIDIDHTYSTAEPLDFPIHTMTNT